jgi:hypothetical protein
VVEYGVALFDCRNDLRIGGWTMNWEVFIGTLWYLSLIPSIFGILALFLNGRTVLAIGLFFLWMVAVAGLIGWAV